MGMSAKMNVEQYRASVTAVVSCPFCRAGKGEPCMKTVEKIIASGDPREEGERWHRHVSVNYVHDDRSLAALLDALGPYGQV